MCKATCIWQPVIAFDAVNGKRSDAVNGNIIPEELAILA